jgi:hypothetical protein
MGFGLFTIKIPRILLTLKTFETITLVKLNDFLLKDYFVSLETFLFSFEDFFANFSMQ